MTFLIEMSLDSSGTNVEINSSRKKERKKKKEEEKKLVPRSIEGDRLPMTFFAFPLNLECTCESARIDRSGITCISQHNCKEVQKVSGQF